MINAIEAALRERVPSALVPAVLLLSPLLLIPSAAAQVPADPTPALAADPTGTLALVQTLLGLGPSGALLAAAYLIGRWQPRIVVELALDEEARRAMLRASRILAEADEAQTEDTDARPKGRRTGGTP